MSLDCMEISVKKRTAQNQTMTTLATQNQILKGKLTLQLVRCSSLKNISLGPAPTIEPHIIIKINDKTQQTPIGYGENPVYNHSMVFEVDMDINEPIKASVCYRSVSCAGLVLIGSCAISLPRLLLVPGSQHEVDIVEHEDGISKAGSITLSASFSVWTPPVEKKKRRKY